MSWTDERVDLLKKLWGEGRTAAEIANALGGVTRNAVIGKANRLSLSRRTSPIKKTAKKKQPANTNLAAVAQDQTSLAQSAQSGQHNTTPSHALSAVKPDAIHERDKKRKRIPLAELKPNQCRWPIGDPRDKNFGFCGCKMEPGQTYCAEHHAAAYQGSGKSRTLSADDLEREEKKRAEKMALNGENFA